MTAPESIARLRAIAAREAEFCDELGQWFAERIGEYTAGAPHGRTLADVFGLAGGGRGERPWWEIEVRDRRDHLVRTIAARHFQRLTPHAAAAMLVKALDRYRIGRWRVHSACTIPPPELIGTLRGDLFQLLKLRCRLSLRIVERALGSPRNPDLMATGDCFNSEPGTDEAA